MANQVNPYIAGNPVTGEEMFFGREDVFDFVRQTLTGLHQDQVIVLYGQRRTGKTSVLYQMHRRLDPHYLPVFIDLHGLALNSLADFLWELANHTRRSLRRYHGIETPPLDRDEFMADPRHGFEVIFLDQVWANSGDRHLLLMLDEAVRLQEQVQAGKLDAEVFAYLRHLMQHQPRLNFLFSLGSGLEEMEKTYALLFNVALYKKISFLERSAAEALIIEPVRDLYQLEPAAVQRILDVTSCQPYYTQLICHGLFNHWQQSQTSPLTVADVDVTLEEAVERGLAVLKHVWEESDPAERAVLAGMSAAIDEQSQSASLKEINQVWAKLDVSIPPGEMAKAIRTLIARDVITGQDDYRFTVDLQRRWLRQYERLEWVKEEIAAEIGEWAAEAPPPRPPRRLASLLTSWKIWAVIGWAVILLFLLSIIIDQQTGGGSNPPVGDATQAQVNDLIVAGDFIWSATDGGLLRWRPDGSHEVIASEDLGFPESCVNTIDTAADGSFWIGCGGVAHFRSQGAQISSLGYYDHDAGLPMRVVRVLAVEQDGQTVMAGGPVPESDQDSPLAHFVDDWNPVNLPIEELNARDMEPSITSILRDRDLRLWLGLERDGILLGDGVGWRFYGSESGLGAAPNQEGDFRVRRLIQDSQGTIWAAAGAHGLLFYDPVADNWKRILVSSEFETISDIAEPGPGELWVAGRNDDGQGFVTHRPVPADPTGVQDGSWTEAGPGQGLGGDLHGLAQTADGRIWLGSYDGGVSVFDGQHWNHLQ